MNIREVLAKMTDATVAEAVAAQNCDWIYIRTQNRANFVCRMLAAAAMHWTAEEVGQFTRFLVISDQSDGISIFAPRTEA